MVLRFPPQGSRADPIQPLVTAAVRRAHHRRRCDSDKVTARNFSPQKKMKLRGTKDLSIAAVGKYGTLQEFSFFDKVSCRGQPHPARVCGTGAPGKGAGRVGSGWGRLGRRAGTQLARWEAVRAGGGGARSARRFEDTHWPPRSCVAFRKPGSVAGARKLVPCTYPPS